MIWLGGVQVPLGHLVREDYYIPQETLKYAKILDTCCSAHLYALHVHSIIIHFDHRFYFPASGHAEITFAVTPPPRTYHVFYR